MEKVLFKIRIVQQMLLLKVKAFICNLSNENVEEISGYQLTLEKEIMKINHDSQEVLVGLTEENNKALILAKEVVNEKKSGNLKAVEKVYKQYEKQVNVLVKKTKEILNSSNINE